MKRIEITFNSYQKELEKLNAQLDRAKAKLEKKLVVAQKYGVENWTPDDRLAWVQTVPTTESGFLINKADEKKNGAWWDMVCTRDEIEDLQDRICRAESRLEKAEREVNAYYEELNKFADLKAKEELMRKRFEQEQAEWKKDGITLKGRYYGITPNGKNFDIYGNNGISLRSRHCFTLRIDGETIFTSGEFWRAYAIIKKS